MIEKDTLQQQVRRGGKTLKLLEALSHGALLAGELCMALSPAYSGAQARNIKKRHASVSTFFTEERERHSFYTLLTHMQKTGLVQKESNRGISSWRITSKGREKKSAITTSKKKIKTPKIPSSEYPIQESDKLIIVIFDIPEKEKYKREWLRGSLIDMTLKLVQKSVWMGNVQLHPAFIADLKKYNLLRHVKIFSATELGNLYN
ncbi:MAG: hypothetical protein Q7S28_01995 [bacterium]|nr:hypothetical protein [bacterium]